MIKKPHLKYSLNAKVMIVVVLAFALSIGVFYGARAVGTQLIGKYYMSDEAVKSRKIEKYNEFRSYVNVNNISSKDAALIAEWTKREEYVTIFIYSGNNLQIKAGKWGADTGEKISDKPNSNEIEQIGGLYPIRFSDGMYQIAISESSLTQKQSVNDITAVVTGCAIFIIILLIYLRRVTKSVVSLARAAQEVGGGNLNKEIYVKGHDELSILAAEMNNMRGSLVERMHNEHRAWQANSDLITAISHDIRTPLTAMIGYLDLLKNGEYKDKNQQKQFTETALGKAMELKELTDKLFQYFLIFNNAELPMEREIYKADVLLEQILGEAAVELRDLGYDVAEMPLKQPCSLNVDALFLKRVTDNLFSNVKKYADKSKKVVILSELIENGKLSICISNMKAPSNVKKESTKIGLQTCKEITAQFGGAFNTYEDDFHFTAEIILPVTPE